MVSVPGSAISGDAVMVFGFGRGTTSRDPRSRCGVGKARSGFDGRAHHSPALARRAGDPGWLERPAAKGEVLCPEALLERAAA
jgi:hypothetical protein